MAYLHMSISHLTVIESLGRSRSTEFHRSICVFRTAANKRNVVVPEINGHFKLIANKETICKGN